MNLTVEKINHIHICTLSERRLDTSNSGLLKGEFASMITQQEVKKLIIDLRMVENCDSSGLSALLVANQYIQKSKGSLRLVPSDKILTLFKVTKLDKILFVCNTTEEAVAELGDLI
ncbi:MAG: STAS domain-containing protein [Ignavibacteria bacterium]|nr:STAS domain-containing protein [Ignavibacteria bacterium]